MDDLRYPDVLEVRWQWWTVGAFNVAAFVVALTSAASPEAVRAIACSTVLLLWSGFGFFPASWEGWITKEDPLTDIWLTAGVGFASMGAFIWTDSKVLSLQVVFLVQIGLFLAMSVFRRMWIRPTWRTYIGSLPFGSLLSGVLAIGHHRHLTILWLLATVYSFLALNYVNAARRRLIGRHL